MSKNDESNFIRKVGEDVPYIEIAGTKLQK